MASPFDFVGVAVDFIQEAYGSTIGFLSFKSIMETILLQNRQPSVSEKPPQEKSLPENFNEEVVPVETEPQQEIITETEFSEPHLVPVNEEPEGD